MYPLVPDVAVLDLVLKESLKTPWWTDSPANTFNVCNMLKWRCDAVGSPFKKRATRQDRKSAGYNLSGRCGPGHLKHKYAVDEGETLGPFKDYFMSTVQSSQAKGSPRKRVCGPAMAKMHWYALLFSSTWKGTG